MSDFPSVLWRTEQAISVQTHLGDVDVMAAVPLGSDGQVARLYLGTLPDENILSPDGAGGVVWSRLVDGAAVVDVLRREDGTAPAPFAGIDSRVLVAQDETALFEGRCVILGHCNGETPADLRDWLVWHQRHYGMTGALVVIRGAPGVAADYAAALTEILRDDPAAALRLAACRIVLTDIDRPLGKATLGHETHPMNAPTRPARTG